MQSMTPPRTDRRIGSLVVGAVLGGIFVAAGLGLAFLTLQTPLATRLVPAGPGTSGLEIAVVIWGLALMAGASFLVAGTNRLAAIAAALRSGPPLRPVAAALGSLTPDVYVAADVVPTEGRPIPEVVVGPFGVAVVHELGGRDTLRQMGTSWERKTSEGWVPTEHPLDVAERDAERVRHWLTHGDLDFVVRVHAALITADVSMLRSPLCAVITQAQIPDWIAALPRQRTFTEGRRQQIVSRVSGRSGRVASGAGRSW